MSAPKTRQLHPCVSIENRSAGADFAVYLTLHGTQHLATAHASVLNVFSMVHCADAQRYTLQLEHSVVLHGSLISLHVVPSGNEEDDLLLLGFTSHCISLVKINHSCPTIPLQAISLLEFDVGIEDLQVQTYTDTSNVTSIAVISNAQLYLTRSMHSTNHHQAIVGLTEPVVLPAGEYGSILSHAFTTSDTILLLHRSKNTMRITALSDQDVILWSHTVANDAQFLSIGNHQIRVVAANSITHIQDQGVVHVTPVNGFCENSPYQSSDTTHNKWSIALDGSRWVWWSDTCAIVLLRRGAIFLYYSTIHRLVDTGKTIPTMDIATAQIIPQPHSLLLFMGSRLADGILLTLEWKSVAVPFPWKPLSETDRRSYEFSAEERELYHIVSDTEEEEDDDKDSQALSIPVITSIKVQDRLLSLAPICTSDTTASVCAVGYGSSGGLGYLHTAGTHGILTHYDLAHVQYVGSIYGTMLVLGFKDRGVHFLDANGKEIQHDTEQQQQLFSNAHILMAGGEGIVILRNEMSYFIVSVDETASVQYQYDLTPHLTSNVVSVTNSLVGGVVGVLEENGTALLIRVAEWNETKTPIVLTLPAPLVEMEVDDDADDAMEDDQELKAFYSDSKITAIDVFVAPRLMFEAALETEAKAEKQSMDEMPTESDFDYGVEEQMLYAEESRHKQQSKPNFISSYKGEDPDDTLYCALCRQSGAIEMYEYIGTGELVLRWRARGVAFGLDQLSGSGSGRQRYPHSQKLIAQEVCFFRSEFSQDEKVALPPKYHLVVETSAGDMYFYRWNKTTSQFLKHPLDIASRQSKEQGRHRAKLVRKGAVARVIEEDPFKHRKFHRFAGISRQTGLFVATFRPFWVLTDRGNVAVVDHRSLHAAPAGGLHRPVAGFCALANGTFVTVHERVGRVGTQRLTLFSNILKPSCIFAGNLAVEKYPLGVTVRKIVALPQEEASDRPLYALLVSRETWVDQSDLNSDGLTDEEREVMKAEKEAIRMKKQVEADLGGFDMESEWVEEIDREDCIQINTELGGAPPIHQPAYSLWIVDASNAFRVVDSYQLEEFEHGIDLKVMSLSDFTGADNKDDSEIAEEEQMAEVPFVVVGTGIVTRDGEDVAAKGRALLFRVQRTKASHVAELSLVYEKTIFHGPVTTISCLAAEGNSRLVIGAGADVNVEQWGDERLTQVGFYRATMHISKIQHFKSFLLLSDAYDSVYFLVWRESDKSLTLLAKDYDPIAVYAAGVLARGAALSLCVHDERENLQFFQYAPAEAAARGGNKLVCRADFHLGETTVNLASTHFCRSPLLVHSATPVSTQAALKQQDPLFGRQDDDHRVGIHFGTADGSLGSIVAVSEPVFWRLMALQSVMANALEFDAGLNPRLWRLYKRSNRGCRNNDRKKGVIDGNLVTRYVNLSALEREDLASSIGTTVELIMDNLVDIQCANKIM